jgi:RND family efflux transporter MFP subunit
MLSSNFIRKCLPLAAVLIDLPLDVYADAGTEFECMIEPSMVVELSSRIDGIVEHVLVERGDEVEPGQIVARLESGVEEAALSYARVRSQMNAEIEQYKTNLNYSQRQAERMGVLYQKQSVASSEIDRARTEAKVARFKLTQAQENKRLAELDLRRAQALVERHTIRSPIRGIVVDRYVNPGESVEDKPITKLAQIDPLHVEVVVPISRFGTIERGQAATVIPEAGFGGNYNSTVTVVDPVLDAASGTFRVRLTLPNPDYALTSGLRCKVRFDDPTAPPAVRREVAEQTARVFHD